VLGMCFVVSVKDANQFGVAIGILQFLLAVTALAGFWTIRNAAKDSARLEANKVAEKVADKVTKEKLSNVEEVIREEVNLRLTSFLQTNEAELLIREQVRQLGLAKFIPPGAVEKAKSANISEIRPDLPAIPHAPNSIDWGSKKLDKKKMIATFTVPNNDGESFLG